MVVHLYKLFKNGRYYGRIGAITNDRQRTKLNISTKLDSLTPQMPIVRCYPQYVSFLNSKRYD